MLIIKFKKIELTTKSLTILQSVSRVMARADPWLCCRDGYSLPNSEASAPEYRLRTEGGRALDAKAQRLRNSLPRSIRCAESVFPFLNFVLKLVSYRLAVSNV